MSDSGTGRRGREPVPTMWTKVMKITQQYPETVLCYSMFVELTLQKQLRENSRRSVVPAWESLFFPDDFKKEHDLEDLERWRLSDEQLEA
jgi:hypothetical protein